jgi:hypothetical protein
MTFLCLAGDDGTKIGDDELRVKDEGMETGDVDDLDVQGSMMSIASVSSSGGSIGASG